MRAFFRHRPEALLKRQIRQDERQQALAVLIVLCQHEIGYDLGCKHCGIDDRVYGVLQRLIEQVHSTERLVTELLYIAPNSLKTLDIGIRNGTLDPVHGKLSIGERRRMRQYRTLLGLENHVAL